MNDHSNNSMQPRGPRTINKGFCVFHDSEVHPTSALSETFSCLKSDQDFKIYFDIIKW